MKEASCLLADFLLILMSDVKQEPVVSKLNVHAGDATTDALSTFKLEQVVCVARGQEIVGCLIIQGEGLQVYIHSLTFFHQFYGSV